MSDVYQSGYEEGFEDGLVTVYRWIVSGIEETDEIALVLRYIEAELGWEGDEDGQAEG